MHLIFQTKKFKHLLLLFITLLSMPANARVVVSDTSDYAPGEERQFSHVFTEKSRVCVKVLDRGREELKLSPCESEKGCLVLRGGEKSPGNEKRGRHPVVSDWYSPSKHAVRFEVVNEYLEDRQLQFSIYEPNYRLNEVVEFNPNEPKTFQLRSDSKLMARVKASNYSSRELKKLCEKKFGCLQIEHYSEAQKRWLPQSSDTGIGAGVEPNAEGEVVFRATSFYTQPLTLKVTAGDPSPDSCRFVW